MIVIKTNITILKNKEKLEREKNGYSDCMQVANLPYYLTIAL